MKRCDEDSGRGDLKGKGREEGNVGCTGGFDVREEQNQSTKRCRVKWCGQEATASLSKFLVPDREPGGWTCG
jgi:hypothetical protein